MSLRYYQPNPNLQIDQRTFKTEIAGLFYIQNQVFLDKRGSFAEIGNTPLVETVTGQGFHIKQLNHSRSMANVVRGFHAEQWNKLVTVVSGKALCVLADIRPNSKTFLSTEYFLLGKEPGTLTGNLYIPSGLGNSICVIQEPVNYIYAVDRLYDQRDPAGDQAVSLFDPDLDIDWPLEPESMIISERDKQGKTLRELFPEKFE